jgi:threonine synthase
LLRTKREQAPTTPLSFSKPTYVTHLECLVCGASYPYGNLFTCPNCGIQGVLDIHYDYAAIGPLLTTQTLSSRQYDQWRYMELLPVSPALSPPPLHIGWTPTYEPLLLAKYIGIDKLFVKDDGRNPTNSFKDRASSVGVLKAIEFGFDTAACASTGNAASSLAGMCAATGLRCVIFVPERAPEPKIVQLLVFGATVFRIKGSYEDAFELSRSACDRFGWYNRNSGTNPFLVEGKKTAGLEIAEQCGEQIPDWVVVPVGDGCTIGGMGKGLREMKKLGYLSRMPRLLGVQAEGAAPVVQAFVSGRDLEPVDAHTLADSIAVGTPRNWRRAVREVRASRGDMVTVSDEEILDAMRVTARQAAVFGEPAGVAGVAGLKKAVRAGIVRRGESALVIITGNGLKDIDAARRAAGQALSIEANMAAVEEALTHHPIIRREHVS